MPKITPQIEKHSPSVPVVPVGQKLKQTTSKECPWVDILPQGSVTLILGEPASGKSALGYFLLERLHYQTRCYVVSLPKVAHPHLPSSLGVVGSLEEIPLDAALLVDEGALQFSARMSASEKNRTLLGDLISKTEKPNHHLRVSGGKLHRYKYRTWPEHAHCQRAGTPAGGP